PPIPALFPYTTLFRSTTLNYTTGSSVTAANRKAVFHGKRPSDPRHSRPARPGISRRKLPDLYQQHLRRTQQRYLRAGLGYLPLRSEEHTSELQSRENL